MWIMRIWRVLFISHQQSPSVLSTYLIFRLGLDVVEASVSAAFPVAFRYGWKANIEQAEVEAVE